MSELTAIITASSAEERNRPVDRFCRAANVEQLLAEARALDLFRRESDNLYEKVRAQFFLYAIHRFHLPFKPGVEEGRVVPLAARRHILERRYNEAIDTLLAEQGAAAGAAISSALAAAYHGLAFQTLAAQVRRSVRAVRGNQWMSRIGHPADHPLTIRSEMAERSAATGMFPLLRESTPVRMDLSHSGWSDIFFLGMDFPEGARVLNVSIDLAVRGAGTEGPRPPVEAYLRVIDEPVLRLTSMDLGATADITDLAEVFDFARDYLGLLKAGMIAAGIVPPAMEGAPEALPVLLARLTGKAGHGIELATRVRGIPKGSRLAVSTSLLAAIITVAMRATSQIRALTGGLSENQRRLVAARAILGEWLGGSGGGWQDSGGVWPGMKTIEGVAAAPGDPEFGTSRGCLLPAHHILTREEVTPETRRRLEESLVLVHGGMAQDVGPILEMVTEKYLLRSEAEWRGRQAAMAIFDEIVGHLKNGDVRAIGAATERNFFGPIQTIIPWASNLYTESLIRAVRGEFGGDFQGFWMLGGMAGGGMGFIFSPEVRARAQERLEAIMMDTKRRLERAVPFAMDPVVYDFAINERGTWAELFEGEALMPPAYYSLFLPALVKADARLLPRARKGELACVAARPQENAEWAAVVRNVFDVLVPKQADSGTAQTASLEELLERLGFDRVQHEQIRADLKSGRIGLAQNRLPASTQIRNVEAGDVLHAECGLDGRYAEAGMEALRQGRVAVVSLAGGIGTRWTRGSGAVKALNPFARLGGAYRNFIEAHLAKSRRTSRLCGTPLAHAITTSYLTHDAIAEWLEREGNYGYEGPLVLSPGRSVGLRLVPMARDLKFAWEETPQQLLDEQKQKVRESLNAALMAWARHAGEGSDYTDNLPLQCLHPTGHWYEIPNLLRNGVLARLLEMRPGLRYLMVHNIDTLGANVDPALVGWFAEQNAGMMFELIGRQFEDRGGGLARVDGRVRLVEGLALPSEEVECELSYYNSNTAWVDIERMLALFGLDRSDLADQGKVAARVRALAARMPTYITLKDVKKRWGKGQEDIFPVAQFEKLLCDMTALPELESKFVVVSRMRGNQLKEPAQLDGWLRDGSAAYVESLCDFGRV
jgi:hypothetical protein